MSLTFRDFQAVNAERCRTGFRHEVAWDNPEWATSELVSGHSADKSEPIIRVPAGFVTDFASIPRAFWVVLPPTGKYGKAAVVHDYLYVMGGIIPCELEKHQRFSECF